MTGNKSCITFQQDGCYQAWSQKCQMQLKLLQETFHHFFFVHKKRIFSISIWNAFIVLDYTDKCSFSSGKQLTNPWEQDFWRNSLCILNYSNLVQSYGISRSHQAVILNFPALYIFLIISFLLLACNPLLWFFTWRNP